MLQLPIFDISIMQSLDVVELGLPPPPPQLTARNRKSNAMMYLSDLFMLNIPPY